MLSRVKNRIAFSMVILVAAALLLFIVKYMHRQGEVSRALYELNITLVRVGGVPIIKGQEHVVPVMRGLPVDLTCDYVPPDDGDGKALFLLHGVSDKPIEAPACSIPVSFVSEPGTVKDLRLEYQVVAPDGSVRQGDNWSLQVRILPVNEFFRIRGLETADGQTITGLSVPYEVIPYTEAALRFDGNPEDFTVLFFVSKLGEDRFALQFKVNPEKIDDFTLISAPLKKARSWGPDMDGLAAWPGGYEPGSRNKSLPIRIGSPDTSREAFEIVAAIVSNASVEAVQREGMAYEVLAEGQAIVRTLPLSLEVIRQLAYKGLVSEPLRVVRARAAAPVPPAAATSP